MNNWAIMMTGLPASGKSIAGYRLAEELFWSYLDKDDFLEALFNEQGVGDHQWRRRLSMEADMWFESAALKQINVVLVSHWRAGNRASFGTPTDWVSQAFANVVEVFCECESELAACRYADRTRHPGHLDNKKTEKSVLSWMRELNGRYPIQNG